MELRRPAGMSRHRYCRMMHLTRSNLYYKKKGESEQNLRLMQEIDKYFTEHPTTGRQGMTDHLRMIGYTVNIKRVSRLMDKMGLEPIYPRKSLSKGGNARHVHPYLLRNLPITHRNQVWSTEISYVPLEHGFMYLYAMIDVYSRYVLGWRLSNTLSARNCYELLQECIEKHGAPEIVNTDQGSQYTTADWEKMLADNHIRTSMDGRGRCKDNIWIERFWRTIKQEYIYLHPTDDVPALRQGIGDWIEFYNEQRPHQSLQGCSPARMFQKAA